MESVCVSDFWFSVCVLEKETLQAPTQKKMQLSESAEMLTFIISIVLHVNPERGH